MCCMSHGCNDAIPRLWQSNPMAPVAIAKEENVEPLIRLSPAEMTQFIFGQVYQIGCTVVSDYVDTI